MDAKEELLDTLCRTFGEEHAQSIQVLLRRYAVSFADDTESARSNLEQRIKQFLVAKRIDGLSTKTLENYLNILTAFMNRTDRHLSKISTDDIRSYVAYLFDTRHLKESSVQTHLNTLRSFFGWMNIEGVLRRNPMLKIRSLKIDKKNTRHALPPEEVEQLRDACQGYRERALFEFFISSGCRLSEVAGISVKSVNMWERCVNVHGKGDKDRTVYFSVRSKYLLEEYLRSRKGGTALFSSTHTPYPPLQPRSLEKIIQRIGIRAGLEHSMYPHLLRHTFAVEALNRGMDITVIQQLLGHEDVSTTQIYAAISQETVRHQYGKYMA